MHYKKLYLILLLICLKLAVYSQGLSLIAPAMNSSCNATIDIPVKVKSFQNLLSLQFSFSWDTTSLKFNGIVNYGPNVLALNSNNIGLNNTGSGQLSFTWSDENQLAQTLPDSTVLLILRFNVTGSNGSIGAINFANNPATIEAIDAGLNAVPVTVVNGMVSISCSVINPLILIVPTVTDTCNTTVDIPVKAMNFQNLLSAQFSMGWDTAKLLFKSIVNFGPNQLSINTANFGLANTNNGNLTFIWSDVGLNPQTLSDSTTLFVIRYLVKGANGASAFVNIISNPTAMEAIDNNLNTVQVNNVNGAVQILCPQAIPLNIIAPVMVDTCKTTADVAIKVKDFVDLQSLQFSVRWDTARLKYASIIDYGATALSNSASNFGTSAINAGKLTYTWSDATALSQTLADSSTLFMIRFQLKGGIGKTDSLLIQNTPTSIEAIDKNFATVPYTISYKAVPVFCKTCPAATVKNVSLSGCNSVTYKGTAYNSSIVVRDTLLGYSGCDSIYNVANITVNKITLVTKNTNITGCKSVVYNTKTYTASTVISDTTRSFQGCDSIINTVNIIVSNITPASNIVNLSGCSSVIYKTKTYTTSTVLLDTTKSIYGCDSLYNTVNITIYKITPLTTSNSISGCNSLVYNGKTYTSSTVFTDTIKSVTGCDSLYFTHTITVYKLVATTSNSNLSGCGSATYKSIVYSSSVNFTDTIKSVNGCDSVYNNVAITITASPIRDTFATKCGSFLWYGTTFFNDTIAKHYIVNNVTNTFSEGFSGTTSITVPTGWTFSGTFSTYTSAGNYGVASPSLKFALSNDQIITPALTGSAKQLSFWLKSQAASGSSLLIEGFNGISWVTVNTITTFPTVGTTITYNASSTPVLPTGLTKFRFTYTKSAGNISFDDVSIQYNSTGGCDSLIALHLTIKKATTNTINLSGCNSVTYKTKTYTSSAIIQDTVRSVLGCDSIINVANITVYKVTAVTNNTNLSGCNAVLYKTVSYTSSTVVRDTVKSYKGCDSIFNVVNITVNKITPVTSNLSYSGCNSVVYKTKTYTTSTLVRDTVKSFQGCDSIYNVVTITVNKITPATNNLSVSGCNSVVYNTKTYTSSTVVRDTIKSYQGCDSIYKVATITVNKITVTNTSQSFNGCGSYTYNSIVYNSSATLKDTIKSYQGCDSIYRTTTITVLKATSNTINLSSCGSVIYKGNTYTSTTTLHDTIKGALGCDSIYNTVNIVIGAGYDISGNIKHPVKTGSVANVSINLTGNSVQSTVATGSYSFTCLSSNSAGVVKAYKNNDINKTNGVTSLDLALLQSHILQKSVLNSPYKIIAADVNGDGKVTTLDIVYMKRLILGIDTTYIKTSTGEKRLWAFIDSSYKFADSTNPFPFKDSIVFSALNTNLTNKTFIAVKLGDVNWDWNPASLRAANKQEFIKQDDEWIDE